MCVYGQSPKMQGESRGLAILLSKQDGVGHRKKIKEDTQMTPSLLGS